MGRAEPLYEALLAIEVRRQTEMIEPGGVAMIATA